MHRYSSHSSPWSARCWRWRWRRPWQCALSASRQRQVQVRLALARSPRLRRRGASARARPWNTPHSPLLSKQLSPCAPSTALSPSSLPRSSSAVRSPSESRGEYTATSRTGASTKRNSSHQARRINASLAPDHAGGAAAGIYLVVRTSRARGEERMLSKLRESVP